MIICIFSIMHNEYHRDSSLRHKLKSSICCFSYTDHAYVHRESLHNADLDYNMLPATPKTPTTPSSNNSSSPWRKKSPTGDFPEPHRGRSRCLLSRIGRRHHRPTQSADFSYDPSSYALNFEDDEFPCRGFASRLKPSPSPSTPTSPRLPPPPSANFTEERRVTVPREIVGIS